MIPTVSQKTSAKVVGKMLGQAVVVYAELNRKKLAIF